MQPLFENTTIYDFETYKQFSKFVSNKINKFINRILGIEVCFLALAFLARGTFMSQTFLLSMLIFPPAMIFKQNSAIKKAWDTNKVFQNAEYHFSFYEDKMEIESPNGQINLAYDKIYKVLEDKNCFFILISVNQGYMVKKDSCSPELMSFIKNLQK